MFSAGRFNNAVGTAIQTVREIGHVFRPKPKRGPDTDPAGRIRLTIAQFGDYAEGFRRFANGGAENYYAQKYTVDFVTSLAAKDNVEVLTVINLCSDVPSAILPNRVRTRGIHLYRNAKRPRHEELVDAVKATSPTHLIVMSPCIPLIAWGIGSGIPTLPMFADSFRSGGFIAAIKHRLLARLLNASSIELVANHNLAASLDLRRIGVSPDKIVPFDWPAVVSPRDYETKRAPRADRPLRLLYVGGVIVQKGVGDAIKAVAELRTRGRQVELTIIGRGELSYFQEMAASESVQPHVFFLGAKSHSEVLAAMREHDVVLVPSHWSYPEGLPMTLYEALCTRTPLLASDHPMFALRIRDRYNALVFPERNPQALADRIEVLTDSPALYESLSANSAEAADNYLCPLKYDRLITDFLNPDSRRALRQYSLATSHNDAVV
jgi:glycosyltransferase involved in cell wall biosynthesis